MCRHYLQKLSTLKPQLDSHNAVLVAVAADETGVDDFMKGNYVAGDTYIDLEKRLYGGLEFTRQNAKKTVQLFFSPTFISKVAKATAGGVKYNMKGDLSQNGGLLVIKAGGTSVPLVFIQKMPTDHADLADILKALGITEDSGEASQESKTNQTPGDKTPEGKSQEASSGAKSEEVIPPESKPEEKSSLPKQENI